MSVSYRILKVIAPTLVRLGLQREKDYVKEGQKGGDRYEGVQVEETYYGPDEPVVPGRIYFSDVPLYDWKPYATVESMKKWRDEAQKAQARADAFEAQLKDMTCQRNEALRDKEVWRVDATRNGEQRDYWIKHCDALLSLTRSQRGHATTKECAYSSETVGLFGAALWEAAEKFKKLLRERGQ